MASFDLLSEHGLESGTADLISVSSYWIIKVIRFAEPLTASKARLKNRSPLHSGNISWDDDLHTITRTKEPLIITNDCISLEVDTSKSRYTQNLHAVLLPGQNYLSAIMPGDWVFAWMMHGEEAYLNVLSKLRNGEAANAFEDGLKFVGQVQDIRKMLVQSPDGLKTVRYNLGAVGFGALDSSVFFDPHLSREEKYIERVLQDLNIPLKEIYTISAKEAQEGNGGIDINKVMPALLKAFIGEGISGRGVASGGLDLATGAAVATKDAPLAYVVPDGVAGILGVRVPSKAGGAYSYADILELLQGLQKYEDRSDERLFVPKLEFDPGFGLDLTGGSTSNRHITAYPLKGLFMPMAVSFDNKSVWNLLQEFLNPAINEMYTAVRYSPNGRVMPTLVIRQLPFSSPVLVDKFGPKVTGFHELPRWKADPILVRGLDVGRSDGERTNFVHIYGVPTKPVEGTLMSNQLTKFPPISDFQDYKRHGLRAHMGQVNTSPVDITHGGPGEWMTFRADFLMGQHLMLTGVCSLVGVTAPIVPGDNFELEDTLYHIEAVHHRGGIDADGRKNFTTQLSLSHGVRADVPEATSRIPKKTKIKKKSRISEDKLRGVGSDFTAIGDALAFASELLEGVELDALEGGGNPDLYLYSGVHDDDNTGQDPGSTTEGD